MVALVQTRRNGCKDLEGRLGGTCQVGELISDTNMGDYEKGC